MLVSVEGVYRNGRVELTESPNNVPEGACVIVTFVSSNDINLASQGIDREQAKTLSASLATFSDDWNSPEMSVFDNYDAAKAHG
ncbi:hypothetical protein [Microcystis aeruginosa]|jgi:hypothetical protein|uniref:Uncharacterized protein n=1 Tax=Microcystis aeruginosa FD4 TaxID=2686288 RepID=A0A857CZI2_MICAE|nr:hypothetical protein [Microcystis aeruginosa]NCR08408.1 hypothetical protein [Microcystis aeruginosa LG13-11]QGZ88569.1 hypothetical protein GQR42_02000 [Microcystis aeruginosa FD4]